MRTKDAATLLVSLATLLGALGGLGDGACYVITRLSIVLKKGK